MTIAIVVALTDTETMDSEINKSVAEMEEKGFEMVRSHHIEIANKQALIIFGKQRERYAH